MLALTGAGIAGGLAGCTGGGGGGGGATPTPQVKTVVKTVEGEEETIVKTKVVEQKKEQVHLLTDYASEAWKKRWEGEIVPAFQEKTGIPVNVEYTGFHGTGESRLTTLFQSGNPPETFTGNLTQNGDLLGEGHLTTATDTVETLIEQNGELISEASTINDEYYLVPHGRYMSTIHYRTDILDKLGLDPPETLEQLLHNAKVIDESDEVKARGFAMPGAKTGQSGTIFLILMYVHGANVFRWKDKDAGVAELWMPKKESIEVLEYMKELAQYSPDPSQVNWGPSLKFWAGGRVAQAYILNAWGAGVAAKAGATSVAKNTDTVAFPTKEGVKPYNGARGFAGFDGHSVIGAADNPEGFKRLLEFMYSDPEESAKNYVTEPTRMLPAYADVFETDTYQNAELFQEFPNLLELNKQAREYGPMQPSGEDAAYSPAVVYTLRFFMIAEMVNQVLVAGRDPEKAFEEGKRLTRKRFQEGRELVEENFG